MIVARASVLPRLSSIASFRGWTELFSTTVIEDPPTGAVYILDQFVKHRLTLRQHLRYSDDFVLVHEDSAQLLAWRAQIEEFWTGACACVSPTPRDASPDSKDRPWLAG